MRNYAIQPVTDEVELSNLLGTIWRGKHWIALIALAGAMLGAFYTFLLATPVYTASADVAFVNREEQFVDLEGILGAMNNDQATLNTEIEVLRSRLMMQKLVEQLSLSEDPEFNPHLYQGPQISLTDAIFGFQTDGSSTPPDEMLNATIATLGDAIRITNLRQSFVFRIEVTTEQADKSALIANTLAELYIRDQLEQKFEATERATAWLSERVGLLRQDLETALQDVKNFNADSAVVNAEQLDGLSRRIKELRARALQAQNDAEDHADLLAQLEHLAGQSDFTAIATLTKDRMLTRLLNADEPQPATMMARVDQLLRDARQVATRARNQLDIYETSIKQLETQLEQQSGELVQLQQLEREAEASRLIYEHFLGRLKEANVQQDIQQPDSRILSLAVPPLNPSAPRKMMILTLSFVLGGFAGLALVLGREMAQNTIRTAEDLEKLSGLAVMGQIPQVPTAQRHSPLQYVAEKPTSAAAEAIRNLRTSTLLSNIDKPPQIIMITSSMPGEGKTIQSLMLAQNLAGLGKDVLVIEGDIRRRDFSSYFEVDADSSMMAVLSGEAALENAVVYSELLNCDVLIGEKSRVNAADVFSSAAFGRLLETARAHYDYVIIDAPPVLLVPDARVIGQSCDAILYAVKWDSTTTRQVAEGLKSFNSVNLRVAGMFITQIDIRQMMRYGLADGYCAYGKYSRGYYDN